MTHKPPDLELYSPAHLCPKCGSEGARPGYHRQAVVLVFGGGAQWPCAAPEMAGVLGEHICSRCAACGFSWMEAVIPGMSAVPPE